MYQHIDRQLPRFTVHDEVELIRQKGPQHQIRQTWRSLAVGKVQLSAAQTRIDCGIDVETVGVDPVRPTDDGTHVETAASVRHLNQPRQRRCLYEMPELRSAKARSEEHTSELQSRFGISYAVFCL